VGSAIREAWEVARSAVAAERRASDATFFAARKSGEWLELRRHHARATCAWRGAWSRACSAAGACGGGTFHDSFFYGSFNVTADYQVSYSWVDNQVRYNLSVLNLSLSELLSDCRLG
jgi:hypothetical protein